MPNTGPQSTIARAGLAAALCLAIAGCAGGAKIGDTGPRTAFTYDLGQKPLALETARTDYALASLLSCALFADAHAGSFVATTPAPEMRPVRAAPGELRYVDPGHATVMTVSRDRCEVAVVSSEIEVAPQALKDALINEWWGVLRAKQGGTGEVVIPLRSPKGGRFELVFRRGASPFLKNGAPAQGIVAEMRRG